jgi:hypothetical protein
MYVIFGFMTHTMEEVKFPKPLEMPMKAGVVQGQKFFSLPPQLVVRSSMIKLFKAFCQYSSAVAAAKKPFWFTLKDSLPDLESLQVQDLQFGTLKDFSDGEHLVVQRSFADGFGPKLQTVICSWMDRVSVLPPHITSFDMSSQSWILAHERKWPCALETLHLWIDQYSKTTPLPVEMIKLNFASLTDLSINQYWHSCDVPMPFLKRLRLDGSPNTCTVTESTLKSISASCPLLEDLYIKFLQNADLFEHLPKKLKKFGVWAVAPHSPVRANQAQKLPRAILDLYIQPVHDMYDWASETLPPNLTILNFDHAVCNDHHLLSLPKSVTKVLVAGIVFTGRALDPVNTLLLSPRVLTYETFKILKSRFILKWVHTDSYPDTRLAILPPSTTRIVDFEFSIFSPDRLPPALMRLPSTCISYYPDIKSLPRSLTRVNLTREVQAPWKILATLPTCLRILKGGTVVFNDDDEMNQVFEPLVKECASLEIPKSFINFARDFFNNRYSARDESPHQDFVTDFGRSKARDGDFEGKLRDAIPNGVNCVIRPHVWTVNLKPRHIKRFGELLQREGNTYPSTIKLQYFNPLTSSNSSSSDEDVEEIDSKKKTREIEKIEIEWPSSMTSLGLPIHLSHLLPERPLTQLELYLSHGETFLPQHIGIEPHFDQINFPSTLEHLHIYGAIVTSTNLASFANLRRLEVLSLSNCHKELKRFDFDEGQQNAWDTLPASLTILIVEKYVLNITSSSAISKQLSSIWKNGQKKPCK